MSDAVEASISDAVEAARSDVTDGADDGQDASRLCCSSGGIGRYGHGDEFATAVGYHGALAFLGELSAAGAAEVPLASRTLAAGWMPATVETPATRSDAAESWKRA